MSRESVFAPGILVELQDFLTQKQDVAAPLKVQAGQPANIAAEKAACLCWSWDWLS
jgi:hypothetical protein